MSYRNQNLEMTCVCSWFNKWEMSDCIPVAMRAVWRECRGVVVEVGFVESSRVASILTMPCMEGWMFCLSFLVEMISFS